MTEFYRIKDEVAFREIKGKKVVIVATRESTPGVVIVRIVDGSYTESWRFLTTDLEPWVEPASTKPVTLPWDDMKIAFGMNRDADRLWRAAEDGRLDLPEGWKLIESDASGARYVVIFSVDVMPTVAAAYQVKAQIRRFDR